MGNLSEDYTTSYGKKVLNMIKEQPLVYKYYDSMAGMAYIPLKEYQESTELQGQVYNLLLKSGTFFNDGEKDKVPHNFAMEIIDLDDEVTIVIRDVISYY